MDVVKSIRIRRRLFTEGENSGVGDIKITLYRKRSKRSVIGFSLNEAGDENFEVWREARYEGERYENLSDDAIIDDFIRVNTIRERPAGDKIKVGFPPKEVTYYEKIQDPFNRAAPIRRSFGFDPYYLNNGSTVYIKWYQTATTEVEWTFSDTTTSTMSATGGVQIKIETNEPGKPPLYFYYEKTTPPFNGSSTPSYFDVESIWEDKISPGINQIAGLSANGQQYLLPGETFIDSEEFISQGGAQYGRQAFTNEGQYAGVVEDSEVVSPLFVRRIEIYPPKDKEGNYIDLPFAVESQSSDTPNDWKFRYISEINSESSLDYKYFIDNQGLEYLKSGKTYSFLKDNFLLADLVQAWQTQVPGYKDVGVCYPDYKVCTGSEYISPVKPLQEALGQTPSDLASITGTTPSVGSTGGSQSKLNFLFPEEFEVVERQDVPDFTIFVGDIPDQEIEGAFGKAEKDDLSELDDEYLEGGFEGEEENLEGVDDAPDDWINQPEPNLPAAGTPASAVSEDGTIVNVESSPPGTGPTGKLVKKSGKDFFIIDNYRGLAGHRLKNVYVDLTTHLKKNGYPGAKIESNGIMRELKASTYPSNPDRAAGSFHGAGLAVDVKFSIPGFVWTSYSKHNKNLANDPKLTKVIAAFVKNQGDLTWGASYDGSDPANGVVKGRGVTEYHHFEIKKAQIAQYWKPFKTELEKYGLDYTDINTTKKCAAAYKKFMAAFGVTS